MEVDTVEFKHYKNLKNLYKLFCVGCVVFLIGFFFIFFGRPYTFDRTNKDLFLPFGLLFLIPGIAVIIGASYLLSKQWKLSNDFAQLNKMQSPIVEAPDDIKGPINVSSPVESLPGYSQLGLDPNEPI